MGIDIILERLSKSKFRNSFRLNERDHNYLLKIGLETAKHHAKDFLQSRLSYPPPGIDGHQTPTKGHPVFVAQHATATCCRSCLYKWHKVNLNGPLSDLQIDYISEVILDWLRLQLNWLPKTKLKPIENAQLPLFNFLESQITNEENK